jgi:hypothetical protein
MKPVTMIREEDETKTTLNYQETCEKHVIRVNDGG